MKKSFSKRRLAYGYQGKNGYDNKDELSPVINKSAERRKNKIKIYELD